LLINAHGATSEKFRRREIRGNNSKMDQPNAAHVKDSAGLLPLIEEAAARIYAVVRETPLAVIPLGNGTPSGAVLAGAAVVKQEQLQITGSFKLRGATNKLMSLNAAQAAAGVVTSSTGNHGLGVATAAQLLGIDAEVFLSSEVSASKRQRIAERGVRIRIVGADPLAAELAARAAAAATGRIYVSPYNDPQVVAGQGTIAVELLRQVPDLAVIFIAVGGGGLVGGIGSYLRHVAPQVEVVGCWPENSPVMYECLKAGRIIDVPEATTLSESTAGGVEPGSITFELCREVIHRGLLVSEAEILQAMRFGHAQGWAMEGASGVALAAYFKDAASEAGKARPPGKKCVVLLCGGNPSPAIAELLAPSV
jgi:threonine dehydratase